MKTLLKEEFTVSISGDIVKAIQEHYRKEDYSLIVENFFKLMLPKTEKRENSMLSNRLRGCAVSSGFADKTDTEIKEIMYKEKYAV